MRILAFVARGVAVLLLTAFLLFPQRFAPLFAPFTEYGAPPIYNQDSLLGLAAAHLLLVFASTALSALVAIGLAVFVTRPSGAEFLPLSRTLVNIGQTFPPVAVLAIAVPLVGWIVIGSFWRIGRFLASELAGCVAGVRGLRATWFEHLLWCVPVAAWLWWNDFPLWLYALAVVVPSNGLLLVRSYCEHRANPAVGQRTAIVEDSWLFGPLFLFNNLHALHHQDPGLPWYRSLAAYRQQRTVLIAANGGLVYRSYTEVARRYLFRAHDALQHPLGRAPSA